MYNLIAKITKYVCMKQIPSVCSKEGDKTNNSVKIVSSIQHPNIQIKSICLNGKLIREKYNYESAE